MSLDLKVRKKGIGGSEVAAILGMDEYSSPYKIWLAKTGREENNVDNKYTRAGIILESAVAEFFQIRTGYRIIKASAKSKTYFHPKYEFALGTPDRTYVGNSQVGKGILECKTTQVMHDEVPDKWFIQLMWYMGILGSQYGSVAWLERGLDFKFKEYEYDPEFFGYLVDRVGTFWNDHILKDVPPEPINIDDIKVMYKRHSEGLIIPATPEMISAHERLKDLKATISELETEKEQLEDAVKMAMRDAEAVADEAKILFTWKAAKNSTKFDTKTFQAENVELYSKYLIETEGSRRFLVK